MIEIMINSEFKTIHVIIQISIGLFVTSKISGSGTWIMREDCVEVIAAKSSHKSGHQSRLQGHPTHRKWIKDDECCISG